MTRTSSDFPVDPGQHVMIGLRVSSCAGARCERGIEYPGDHAGCGESGCLVLRCGIRSHTLRRENSDRPSAGRRDGGRHMDCPPAGRIGVLGHRGSGQRLLRRHRQCGSRCREGLARTPRQKVRYHRERRRDSDLRSWRASRFSSSTRSGSASRP